MITKRMTNTVLGLLLAAALLLAPLGALAEAWSAPFSAEDVQPISEEDNASVLAYLDETSLGLDPDEVDYSFSYSVDGTIELNGQRWYIGRWSKEFDDHVELVTDFLLDTETLQMYPCTFPDVGVIEWTSELEPEGETIGEMVQPVPYLSANGFSLAYDAAYLAPMELAGDRFIPLSGETGISLEIHLERELRADQMESYLAEMVDGDAAVYPQHGMVNGATMQSAVVTRGENTIFYYLLPFGDGALFIVAQCPTSVEGEWGARFDLMAQSITF